MSDNVKPAPDAGRHREEATGEAGGAGRRAGAWVAVAETLQTEIIGGRVHAREHLVEDEVMGRFGVSRHTARRALDEVVRAGLAVRRPNRGVFVRGYAAEEVEHLYELREVLETRAAERIPVPAPAALVEALRAIQERHEAASRAGLLARLMALNDAFHGTLYAACGNPMLAEAIRLQALRSQPIRMRISADAAWRRQAVADHRRIVEALERPGGATLPALCREHILGPKRHYLLLEAGGAEEG